MADTTAHTELQDAVLLASLPHVAFDGWTDRTLRAGAASAGLDSGAAKRAFPGGGVDAIAHFSDWADRSMASVLEVPCRRALDWRRLSRIYPYGTSSISLETVCPNL